MCGAPARNCAHRYIGKVFCLLLVQADYIGRAPGRGQEGTGDCSSFYTWNIHVGRQTHRTVGLELQADSLGRVVEMCTILTVWKSAK